MATVSQHRNVVEDELLVDALAQDCRQCTRWESVIEAGAALVESRDPFAREIGARLLAVGRSGLDDERSDRDTHLAIGAVQQARRNLKARVR